MDKNGLTRIGSDECLKGDTFGGIVVAAAKAGPLERKKLASAGVRDSKKVSDKKVPSLEKEIIKILGMNNIHVVEMLPEEYNKIKKLTALLNSMHSSATKELLPADEVVVDQYPGCKIEGAVTETKAESKYIEVAAASILARAAGLRQIKELSKNAGFELPLGSTHVKDALLELKKRGLPPENFVKMDFRNVKESLGRED